MMDDDIVARAHRHYSDARSQLAAWREEAVEAYDFYAGRQWQSADESRLKREGRPPVTFNRVGVIIDSVVGSEVNNRQDVRFIPRERDDHQVSEALSAAAQWVRDECDAEDEETDAFADLLICGMGWTETRIGYDQDPDGRIVVERIDPLEMYWDPAAVRRNLEDARWFLRLRDVSLAEAEGTWPEMASLPTSGAPWDGDGMEMRETDSVLPGQESDVDGRRQRVRIGEYQWCDYESAYRVLNPLTEQIEDLSEAQFLALQALPETVELSYEVVRLKRWRRAFIVGRALLHEGEGAFPDGPTFHVMTGRRDRNQNAWFGLVRAMRDPQQWANKFFSQIIHILNTNSKGGVLAERDAFEDPRDAEDNWARPDAIIWTNPGALSNGKIQPKPVAPYPAALDRLMEFSIASVRDTSGVNVELLGMADRQQAGVLEYQRKQAGITILAQYFDSLKKYRKIQGRVLLHFIRSYLSDGRLLRVLGIDGSAQILPLIKAPETARYDVVVDEAPSSPNQRDRVFQVLTTILPTLTRMGIPLPPELLDYAPLPSALVARWKQLLAETRDGQDQQAKAEAQQMVNAQQRARIAKELSSAALNLARAEHERAETLNEFHNE